MLQLCVEYLSAQGPLEQKVLRLIQRPQRLFLTVVKQKSIMPLTELKMLAHKLLGTVIYRKYKPKIPAQLDSLTAAQID